MKKVIESQGVSVDRSEEDRRIRQSSLITLSPGEMATQKLLNEIKKLQTERELQNQEIQNLLKMTKNNNHILLENDISQVSDFMKIRKDLQTSEKRYRRLFESAKDGILILNVISGQITDVNPFLLQLLGYSYNELIGKELWEIGFFKNIDESKDAFIELQKNKYIRFEDLPLETKKGRKIDVEFVCNVYLEDRFDVIQCNIRDITARKQAEEKIKTFEKAIEQGPSAIEITNAEGEIQFVNNQFTRLTQFSLDDVKGQNPRIFRQGPLSGMGFETLWKTLSDGKIWKGEHLNTRKDESSFWEEITISAVTKADGTVSNYILIMNDISEKKQMIDDLIVSKEKAEESDVLKSSFLANLSHELRTPLNSIIGFSELMNQPDFNEDQNADFTTMIQVSGKKLLAIITDLMDISKIEASQIQVRNTIFSVNQLLEEIHVNCLIEAPEAVELRLVTSKSIKELYVETDKELLKRILINIVNNSIKFTSKGFVEIGCKLSGNYLQFHVKDTGIGIPLKFHDTIFERFRQVEFAFTREYGGNGLGLPISKGLVELLNGKIWVESVPGKGSTFFFKIPYQKTAQKR